MAIDLQKCHQKEGCNRCIKACHAAHNVPQFADQAHEVKWVWKQPFENVFPFAQTQYTHDVFASAPVLLMCNHCDDPPCQDVCPVGATWRREDGVVMMDFHRCIGCRYCMAVCPYGSRSFNWQDPRPAIAEAILTFQLAQRESWKSATSVKKGWRRTWGRCVPRLARKKLWCSEIWNNRTRRYEGHCAHGLRYSASPTRHWSFGLLPDLGVAHADV